TLNTH
ncbi:NADH(P)-binding family protein, partial [Vibrio parahaemolyticus V-223/04]